MGVCTSEQNRSRSFEHEESTTDHCKNKSIIKRCHREVGLVIIGFIRGNPILNNLPSSIKHLCKLYFGCMHGDLIIEQNEIFRLAEIFEYNSILIKKNSTLTLNRYNPNNSTGGILNIICNANIILEGAKISMNGRGYYGGQYGRFGQILIII